MRNIFITGGAGFIGSHLAEHHLKKGDAVWALDNCSTGNRKNIDPLLQYPHFRFIEGDVVYWEGLGQALQWAHMTYHLAALVGQQLVIHNSARVIHENIQGCSRVLSLTPSHGKVLIASSSEVYGKNAPSFNENAPLIFPSQETVHTPYPLSKFVNEVEALSHFKEKKCQGVIARLFNTAGPRQTGHYGMVVPRLVHQAVHNFPMTVFGSGNQTRAFCHIQDMVAGLELLLTAENAHGEVFNIGNDHEISILDLALLIKEITHSGSEIIFLSYEEAYGIPFEDTQKRCPDLSKIKERLGFAPQKTVADIIKDIFLNEQSMYVPR